MLYIVATPIGHMSDITYRAVETLKSVDTILAEDTRQTRKLLKEYHIQTPLYSYHDHNKERRTPRILGRLKEGNAYALVSDAGTPGISDPGFYLVRACRQEGIDVAGIPGANAAITALSISGLPTDAFSFYGFLPKKKGKMESFLSGLSDREETIVLYESPHRIKKTLTAISEVLGEWDVCVCRELTKRFETTYTGKASELIDHVKEKGECVIVMHRPGK